MSTSANNDLLPYTGTLESRADSWAGLSDEALRRRALEAVRERNHEALWSLTEAFLFLRAKTGARISKHTLKAYRRGVRDLLAAWAHENLLRPSRDAGHRYARLLELRPARKGNPKPLEPSSIQVKLAAARTLYKALRWAGATDATPFLDVQSEPDKTDPWLKRSYYTPTEVERLLEHASAVDQVIVLLGAHAGLRIAEMASLEWADVDRDFLGLAVSGKGGKRAWVPCSGRLAAALAELQEAAAQPERGRVSPARTGKVLPFGDYRVRERFRKLCLVACVAYAGREVHGLRHSAGTRIYEDQHDLGAAATHLRHANVQTTRRYAHPSQAARRKAVEDW